jgi:hypothetical protein
MRMTMAQYELAIRSAFEEGYFQGVFHERDRNIITEGRRIGAAFWQRVLSGIEEKRRDKGAA